MTCTGSSDATHCGTLFPARGRHSIVVLRAGIAVLLLVACAGALAGESFVATTVGVAPTSGRITGRVTSNGVPVIAAVHAYRSGALAAQQMTGPDGTFDFTAIPADCYSIDASAVDGATPWPREIEIIEGETREVELQVVPRNVVRAFVRTPQGVAASGALVRVSEDRGTRWTELVLGASGELEYPVPAGVAAVDVVVVAPPYPASMTSVGVARMADAPPVITLMSSGGRVRVHEPRAYIHRESLRAPAFAFFLPSGDGVEPVAHLEPGAYVICDGPESGARCGDVTVTTGGSTFVDFDSETAN